MAEDLKELTRHVPALMLALRKANLVPPSVNAVVRFATLAPDEKSVAQNGTDIQKEGGLTVRVDDIERPKEISEDLLRDQSPQRPIKVNPSNIGLDVNVNSRAVQLNKQALDPPIVHME
jgi:hypothetical protein